ncbi:trypsin-like peptidase domain-containing protein [Kitasatospora sp. NBC_01287]|uniref:S1C family serine protease n=1 Tax=Kitasatospora sp. NBC_01287 TaxID=2903573 RepID=UPI0022599D29|nr:trypsin-like peptidase domain-containing protein [Kitasatospora sp. NBC_01287]MCX4747915.1 trypsin-like peptidase domain-containing protein [Kitasatospora sp. NBC_01287]
MSTEHESGSTGPQGEQLSSGHGEPGGTSAVGDPRAGTEPAASEPTMVLPAADPGVADASAPERPVAPQPTLALTKVPAPEPTPAAPPAEPARTYLDAPPPAAPGYLDAPPPVPSAPAVEPPANPYAAPAAPLAAPPVGGAPITPGLPAAGAPQGEQHHPFGAGTPIGDAWSTPQQGLPGYPEGTEFAGHPQGGVPGYPGGPEFPGEYPGGFAPPPAPRKKGKGSLIALIAAVALVAGVAGGVAGAALKGNGSSGSSALTGNSRSSTTTTSANNQVALNRAPDSVAGIAGTALPSTVTIKAEGSSESGTGTGFIFDTQGHILTNNHVVAPADNGGKLSVKFSDGNTYPASVVGKAKGYDLAVVKLDAQPSEKLTPLPLGDSDQVAVGDVSIAIGAPYDLESTVTSGIISAKNRPVASGDQASTQTSYMNALQTDASINPGNSGGPLLNASGQVIGINSAIQSNSSGSGQAGSIGLGFAIPINQAKRVAQMLITTGTPVYATLGVLRNDDYSGDGAQIMTSPVGGTPAVTPGGPADQAGLKPGDVITKLGGEIIDNGPALVSAIWTHAPGDKVDVDYTRNGTSGHTSVTLGSRSGDQ